MDTHNKSTQIIELDNSELSTAVHDSSTITSNKSYSYEDYPKKDTDLRDLLKTLLERKGFILSMTLLGTLLSMLVTLSTVPMYRAEAILKIDPEEKQLLSFDVSTGSGTTKAEQYFKTQLKLLKSKSLARKVIDSLNLDNTPKVATAPKKLEKPFFEKQLDQLKNILRGKKATDDNKLETPVSHSAKAPLEQSFLQRLSVSPMGKSFLVNVSYDSEDPELAATIVNSLIKNFIEMNLESRIDSASHAKSFLDEEIASAKAKLKESEKKMLDFEREKGIVSTGSQSLIDQKLTSLNQALSRATQERIAEEAALGSSASARPRKVATAKIKALNTKLQQLRKEYQENLKIYKPAYPLMKDIQYKIQETQKEINAEINAEKAQQAIPVTNSAKTKVTIARKKEAALKAELDALKSKAISTRDNIIEYQELKHEVDTNRTLYENLRKRQKEIKVAGGADKNNLAVIDPAVAPFNKHSPNTKLNLIIGTLLGFFSSTLIALLLGHKDDRIKSVEDIAAISDLPILGIFPFTKELSRKKQFVQITNDSSSPMAEAFRSLRTNLQFATAEGLPKILHITSSEAGEGKSNTSLNLATVFAQTKKSVLLIDADLRKPSVHRYLQLKDTTSLGTGLINNLSLEEMETPTALPDLTVIAGEAIKSTPADLLSGDEMVHLLERASDKYDLVILDSPPIVGLADSLVLANRSSATLFVVASHQTTKTHLKSALKRIRMGYGNVIGFAFTKARKQETSSYIYDYGGEHLMPQRSQLAAPRQH